MIAIRRLGEDDADDYQSLRLQALRDSPESFSSSVEEEAPRSRVAIAQLLANTPDSTVFGAFDDATLIGIVGIRREQGRKAGHKAHVWGMYVAPSQRGNGVGRWLVAEALRFAAAMHGCLQVTLTVTASNAHAKALYESLGFMSLGTEPRALLIDGVAYDDVRMVRYLVPLDRPQSGAIKDSLGK